MDINFEGKVLLSNEIARKIQLLNLATSQITDIFTGLNKPIDVVEQNPNTLLISEYNSGTILKHDLSTNTTETLAPGQGFFVKSAANSNSVNFTPEMRTISNTDDFVTGRSSTTTDVALAQLELTKGSSVYSTAIYFNSNASRFLDPDYDAGAFSDASLNIYSKK